MRRAILVLAAAVAVLAGCESSQEKSARLKARGGQAFQERGLDVRKRSRSVKVVASAVLQDKNGAAAVVVLHSSAPAALRGVPVAITVKGHDGKPVFKNDQPGIEASLTGPSVLQPGKDFAWINDQVVANAPVASVDSTVGVEKGAVHGALPKLDVSPPRLQGDPVSGLEAVGEITNRSKLEQRNVILYCVAIKDRRIVAAGRGAIPRLRPGKPRSYHIFFIGNPTGASLSIEAPPTKLQ